MMTPEQFAELRQSVTNDELALLQLMGRTSVTPYDAQRILGKDMQSVYDSLAHKGLAVISFSRWRITVKGKQLMG